MGRLQTKAAECDYEEYGRKLSHSFMVDDKSMVSEILREVVILEDMNNTTSKWVLSWAPKVEAQRLQKEAVDNKKEAKDFDLIIQNMQRQNNEMHRKQKQVENS